MPIELTEYYEELFQEIHGTADADGKLVEDVFFEVFTDLLTTSGEIDTADRVFYTSQRGLRVDGYGGDPAEFDGVLSLIISEFNQDPEIITLNARDIESNFNRLRNFVQRSLDPSFRNSLEESAPVFGLADIIAARWTSVSKVRLFLISNRVLSTRMDGLEAGEIEGIPVAYSVWDLRRAHRFDTSGQEREDIVVRLDECGGPLVLLPAHMEAEDYESYLAVVPGSQLATIYDRWGSRLLEQNVRVFLQARNKVNRGIRNTIQNSPEMFFAYNNGITATAESVETVASASGLLLTVMRNFQIVNGGQTTASIHAALRNKDADLNRVFVQMKLSIVEPERAQEVVPKISEYANSQNRVNAADFFSNHPYHVRIEGFSRRIYAPSKDGSFRESKWFYERARGQYQDARSHLTPAERRRFDLEYPKRQKFAKTDLAKFTNVWRGKPHIVSRGAQKNFADFAAHVGSNWKEPASGFNEMYYRETVAKAIVFRSVERLVTDQPWYQGGYRANVVAYTIAKLAHDVEQREGSINFQKIWREQQISDGLLESLTVVAKAVHDVIIDPPSSMRNVTEWAKQQACWNRVMQLEVLWPESLNRELMTSSELKEMKRAAIKDQRVLNGIEAQMKVCGAGADLWTEVRDWGNSAGLLSPDDFKILEVVASMPAKVPTERQSQRVLTVLRRLQENGCELGADIL